MTLSLPIKGDFFLDSFGSVYIHLVLDYHVTTGVVNEKNPPENISMDLIPPLCGIDYQKAVIYSDIQTPYVQAEDDPY